LLGPCEYELHLEKEDWTEGIVFVNDIIGPVDKQVSECIQSHGFEIFDTKDICMAIRDNLVLSVRQLHSKQTFDETCDSGRTPVQEALAFGNMEVIDILVAKNYTTVVDSYGRSVNDIYNTFNATQASWYADEDGNVNVDDIYHLENIQSDYKILQEKIPCLKTGKLPHKKKGKYKDPWQNFYTNKTVVKIMQEVYDIDFEYFGYSKYIN